MRRVIAVYMVVLQMMFFYVVLSISPFNNDTVRLNFEGIIVEYHYTQGLRASIINDLLKQQTPWHGEGTSNQKKAYYSKHHQLKNNYTAGFVPMRLDKSTIDYNNTEEEV